MAGRWLGRDNYQNYHEYDFCNNKPTLNIDLLGNNLFTVVTLSFVIPIGGFFIFSTYRSNKNKGEGNAVLYSPNQLSHEGYDAWSDWQTGVMLYDQNVYSRNELRTALLEIQNKYERRCINNIRLAAHGSYAGHINEHNGIGTANMTLGKEELRESINEFEISNLFEGISFCHPCSIELRSCNIGKSPLLRERLKKYGCDVILYDDYIAP